ncbi:hypothetical protein [Pseudomonas sp. MWU13-2105]|uniref:hypothetical protein n=1 Tax=Pseudomonas sp. MWU13-2105 TaxID=2935074 RepID=UPI00200FC6FF|nr:hypothetical protein [Pseudomonas sp. MWU13-2105]
MSHVYIEPRPSVRKEEIAITYYDIEYDNNKPVTNLRYKTQKEAIDVARKLGFTPLVARVRITNKRNPEHWRFAD